MASVKPGTDFATLQWVYVVTSQPVVTPPALDSIKKDYNWQQ